MWAAWDLFSCKQRDDLVHGKLSLHVCWIVSEQQVRRAVGRKDLGILDACSLSKGAWRVKDEGTGQGSLRTTAMPPCCVLPGRASPFLQHPSWRQVTSVAFSSVFPAQGSLSWSAHGFGLASHLPASWSFLLEPVVLESIAWVVDSFVLIFLCLGKWF